MFNLNIPPSSLLGIEGSGLCSTPKTPEILNSLIAMTNPMDNYNFSTLNSIVSPTNSAVSVRNLKAATNLQSSCQDSCHSSCSGSPLDSPAGTQTTPSIQQTCSQLIKAGLKLSIQSKRKLSTCDSSSGSEQPNSKCSRRDEDCCDETTDDDSENKLTSKGLTPEDEDRRRRRRERNKIAATKCRMKKRERTQNLIKESEQLDTQNIDLKHQVRILEMERRKLLEMLQGHSSSCRRRGGFNLSSKLLQSPAYKYITDLDLDGNNGSSIGGDTAPNIETQTQQLHVCGSQRQSQRTVIPPVSTIKFSRNNGFKAGVTNKQQHQLPAQSLPLHQQQLPNGYCKPSPTQHELGYLNSPSQDSICLSSLQSNHSVQTHTAHLDSSPASHQNLSDYIPNCDNSLSMRLVHTSNNTPTNGDSSAMLCSVATPTSANEFVKNELIDSQSPYTTDQSAGRFLFESNCDSFVDIKNAVSVHNNSVSNLGQNNSNNMLDFHSSSVVPFHDQISIKNDFLHDPDLLAQLTGDAGEFVDLDTGVAAAFGGCLA